MSIQNHVAVTVRRAAIAAAAVFLAGLLPSSMSNAQMTLPLDSVPGLPSGQTRNRNVSVTRQGPALDVEMTFSPQDVSLSIANGFAAVDLPGCRLAEQAPGHPLLPARFVNVLIPGGAKVESIDAEATEILLASDVLMYPAQPPVPVSAPLLALPAFVPPDPATYALVAKLPAAPAELTGQHQMRGHVYASLRINPVRYVPAARELYLATRIKVRLHCADVPRPAMVAGRDRHNVFRSVVADIVVNSQMLDEEPAGAPAAPELAATEQPTGLTDYLIITSDALSSAFQPLAEYRAGRNGFTTAVVSTETIAASYTGIDIQAKIRACITDYVRNRGTAYVVLGGDDTVVLDRNCSVSVGSTSQGGMPTDLYYAGLDGTWDVDNDRIYGEADAVFLGEGDLAPDVYVGRIPVRTAQQAASYINKVIQFEENPIPADEMLLAGVHLGSSLATPYSPYTGTNRPTDIVTDGCSDFALHSPISDTEMWTRRLYRDCVQKYSPSIVPSLLFDTVTTWDSGTAGSYMLSTTNFSTQLNQGWYHVFMMTHGNTTSWDMEGGSFNTTNASLLTGRLGFIYTGSCNTGRFDDAADPCLSEAFLRNANGPVAYFGCSREGWYSADPPPASIYTTGGTSMEWARDFYDQFYCSPHTSLAQVFYAHKTANAGLCGFNGPDRWIMFGMNYQGDPALLAPAVPQVPRTLTVNVHGVATVVLDPPGGTYDHGTSVQVTIVPNLAWKFVRWEGAIAGSANPATLVMNGDKTITAVLGIKGDINSDGYVNVGDLQMLVATWGKTIGEDGYDGRADCDGNNSVNVGDLQLLVANWGYFVH